MVDYGWLPRPATSLEYARTTKETAPRRQRWNSFSLPVRT